MILKPKGTYDIYGNTAKYYNYINEVFKTVCEYYNYEYIRTPILKIVNYFTEVLGKLVTL